MSIRIYQNINTSMIYIFLLILIILVSYTRIVYVLTFLLINLNKILYLWLTFISYVPYGKFIMYMREYILNGSTYS